MQMKREDLNKNTNLGGEITNIKTAASILNTAEIESLADERRRKKLKRKVIIRNVIICLLAVIIVILLLKSCSSGNVDLLINRVFNQETNEFVEDSNKSHKSESIDIPVIFDTTVSEDQPYMNFSNPETNADKFYLKYEIYTRADDKLLYASEMVEPSQKFSANLYDVFEEAGTYYCYVKVRTFEFGSMTERNGISNDIIITVK